MRLITIMIVCLLLLGACSSLPKQVQPQEKKNADMMLGSAQKYENQHHYTDAIELYRALLPQYRAIGEIEGQLVVLAGLARISLIQNPEQYTEYQNQMQSLVDAANPQKRYHLQILELYRLHKEAQWESISALAKIEPGFPDPAALQILSYKVQADAYLTHPNKGETTRLEKLYAHYRRLLRSRKYSNPELVSNAAYALGYHYTVAADLTKAGKYVQQAQQIDYAYGLFYSYAYDLWLGAQLSKAQGDPAMALSLLSKAHDIFGEFQDIAMQDKIAIEIEQLKENRNELSR